MYKGKLEDNLYVAVKRLEVGRQNAIKEFEVVPFTMCLIVVLKFCPLNDIGLAVDFVIAG